MVLCQTVYMGIYIMNLCRIAESLGLYGHVEPIIKVLKCAGIDYSTTSDAGVWCLPLYHHRYANRMHLNTLYRFQDPYHNNSYIDFLPKILSLADIATLSDQSELWKPLLNPINSDTPPCFAMSFVFNYEYVKHRFVFYYTDWKDLIHFYVNLINIPQKIMPVISILKSTMLENFTPFFIAKDKLNSLNLSHYALSLSENSNLLNTENKLNNNELNLLRLLALGINKTSELAKQLHVSVRTIEDYTQNIRKKLKLINRYELHDYARKFQILQSN